jgi:glycosyl transferase family 25
MSPDFPILVINLDRDPDRLEHMQREFGRVGLPFERIPGIYGTDLTPDLRPYFCHPGGPRIASSLTRGEIGCYAGHISAWRAVVERDIRPGALVCEDDIVIPDSFPSLLGSIVETAPKGWDIIRLSSSTRKPVSPVAPLTDGYRLIRYWKIPWLAGAYLISPAGAEKLLRPFLRNNGLDEDISMPWVFGLDAYGVVPMPVQQNIGQSTIDEMEQRQFEYRHMMRKRSRFMRLHYKIQKFPLNVRHTIYNLSTMGLRNWVSCLSQRMRRKKTNG